MKYYSSNEQIKDLKSDEDVKIVKHSSELIVELPSLETTDSIDRQSNDSANLVQNINLTPTKCSKRRGVTNVEYMGPLGKDIKDVAQNDVSNAFGSYSSSLVSSVERTTAPSSMTGSLSRYESCYSSNQSPSTNFHTPCGRDTKRRNVSNSSFDVLQNKENDQINNSNNLLIKKDLAGFAGSNNNVSGVLNNMNQSNQVNGSVLLSAVLQVIASIQKLKSGEQSNGINRGLVLNNSNVIANNTVSNSGANSAAQILGSKLPGVHPTTAALALAYSLSVAASAKRTSGGLINSDDIIQNLNQIISERNTNNHNNFSGNVENLDNLKVTGELMQNIVSSLSSLISHTQGEPGNNIHRKDSDYLISPSKANELNNNSRLLKQGEESKASSSSSYNLKLPPMDFVLNDNSKFDSKGISNIQNIRESNFHHSNKLVIFDMPSNGTNTINYQKLSHVELESSLGMGTGIDDSFGQFEYINQVEANNNNSQAVKEGNNPFSLILSEVSRYSDKKIILESSNNCIWNDISYNQVFDHVDFETPFSRKHAYLRNELIFFNKPILEIDHGGDSFSVPNYIRIPSIQHPQTNNKNMHSNNYNNINNSNLYGNYKTNFSSVSKYSLQNNDFYNLQRYNSRIQSFCDDLLVNSNSRKNSQIFNSINYLMQIVGDGNINNNNNINRNIN